MLANLPLLTFMEAILIAGMALFHFCLKRNARPMIKPLYAAVVLLTPVAGLFLGNYNLFYLFVFVVPFAARGKRKDLACLYLAMLPQFPELGQAYTIGTVYFGTVSAVAFLNFGALVALFAVRRRERATPKPLDICVWGMFLVMFYSQARGLEISGTMRQLQFAFLNFVPPYLVLTRTLRTREEAQEALLVFTWACLLAASIALFESVRGWPLYQTFYVTLNAPAVGQGLSATLAYRSGFLRAQGPICNSTALGVLLAVAALIAPGLQRYFAKPQVWAIYGTLVLGLIATQSRGAWIGAGVGYLVRLLFQRRFGLFFGVAALGLVAWTATGILEQEGQMGQLLGKSGAAEMTAEYRSNLFRRGVEEVQKHMFSGQTPDQLQVSMDDMRQSEHIIDFVNSHLYIALTCGIEGLLLWLGFWISPLLVAFKAQSRARRMKYSVPLEIPCSILTAIFVALIFTSPIDRNPSLIALALAFAAVLIRAARRGPAASAPRGGKVKAVETIVGKSLAVA
jgi:hypothetical protein